MSAFGRTLRAIVWGVCLLYAAACVPNPVTYYRPQAAAGSIATTSANNCFGVSNAWRIDVPQFPGTFVLIVGDDGNDYRPPQVYVDVRTKTDDGLLAKWTSASALLVSDDDQAVDLPLRAFDNKSPLLETMLQRSDPYRVFGSLPNPGPRVFRIGLPPLVIRSPSQTVTIDLPPVTFTRAAATIMTAPCF